LPRPWLLALPACGLTTVMHYCTVPDSLCSTNCKGYKTTLSASFATLVAARYTQRPQLVAGPSSCDVQSGDALLQIPLTWSVLILATSTIRSYTPAATFRLGPVSRAARMDCYWRTTVEPFCSACLEQPTFKTHLKTDLLAIA